MPASGLVLLISIPSVVRFLTLTATKVTLSLTSLVSPGFDSYSVIGH